MRKFGSHARSPVRATTWCVFHRALHCRSTSKFFAHPLARRASGAWLRGDHVSVGLPPDFSFTSACAQPRFHACFAWRSVPLPRPIHPDLTPFIGLLLWTPFFAVPSHNRARFLTIVFSLLVHSFALSACVPLLCLLCSHTCFSASLVSDQSALSLGPLANYGGRWHIAHAPCDDPSDTWTTPLLRFPHHHA